MMSNGDQQGVFLYPTLTLIIDSYNSNTINEHKRRFVHKTPVLLNIVRFEDDLYQMTYVTYYTFL